MTYGSYDPKKNYLQAADTIIRKRTKDVYEDVEEIEKEIRGGLTVKDLSDDQKRVFDSAVAWFLNKPDPDGVEVDPFLLTIGGYAGTGKTTLTSVIANTLVNNKETRSKHYGGRIHIAFCAFTGKAASRLKQKLRLAGIHANTGGHPHFGGTIHSLMYKPMLNELGEVMAWDRQDELPYDLIVVDEASMVDAAMLEDLKSYDIPIMAVGDHGQLFPVKGEGSLMVNPDLRLEKIHRQAEDSPIIRLAKEVRDNGNLPATWNDDESVSFITFNDFDKKLVELFKQGVSPHNIAILTYTNKCRQNMNYLARCYRNEKDMPDTPVVGDLFMCLRNMKGVIFNGMRGELVNTPVPQKEHWYEGTFFFPDDELEADGWILREQIGREKTFSSWEEISRATGATIQSWKNVGMLFDYGYSLTVHKAQGSEFKHVFVIYEQPPYVLAEEYRRWLYTAVTRSSQHLYIVVG